MIIRFKYEGLSEIMRMINRNKLQVIDQSYDLEGRIQILLKESDLERVSKLFNTSPYVKNIENLPG